MALDVNSVQYVAPVFTPRDKDGRVNFDIIPLYVEYLIHNGVQGILIGGSAGEGILQSNRERISVALAFIRAVRRRMTVIVHAGGVNYDDTISLCDRLSDMEEVDCIMLSVPLFYPYYNYTNFVNFLVDAGKVCKNKPILYYHFPSLTRLEYDVVATIATLKRRLPNFIGLKYTANDGNIYRELVNQEVKIFLGFPSMALVGAQTEGNEVSFITGPTNFANGLMTRIVNLVLQGDVIKAKVLQNDLDNLMNKIVVERELMPSMSYVMDIVGIPMGTPTKPLDDLTNEQKKAMKENLSERASECRYLDLLDDNTTVHVIVPDTSFKFMMVLHISVFSLAMWLMKR